MAATSTRTLWKGAISFGLVHIPIALHSATEDVRPRMKLVDKATNAPIGHKNYDKSTGEEVAQESITKGVETSKGHFVVLSKEEIREALPRTTGTIGVEQFAKLADIPLVYFSKPYYISPQAKGAKPYGLFRDVLKRTGRVGLGRVVISTKQHLAIVAAWDDALVLILLRWAEEIRDTAGLPLPGDAQSLGISEREMKMAESLVMDLDEPFDAAKFRDEYSEKIEALVEAKKKAGEEQTLKGLIADEVLPTESADIIDLTELLRRSLRSAPAAAAGKETPGTRKRAAANDEAEPVLKKAAAKKSSGKSTTTVKPTRRKTG